MQNRLPASKKPSSNNIIPDTVRERDTVTMLSGTTEKLDDTARNMEKLLDETRNLLKPLRSNNNSRT